MMIEAADFLSDFSLKRLDQTRMFMSEYNVSGVTYSLTTHPGRIGMVDVDIVYSARAYEGQTPEAKVTLATRSGAAVIETQLYYGAIGLLTLLADQPDWLQAMRDLDPEMSDNVLWPRFRLDPQEVFRDDLKPVATGEFIAPRDDGYVYFSVDTHGEVTIQAGAKHLAVIAFHFAAEQATRALRVDEKFGRLARFAKPVRRD